MAELVSRKELTEPLQDGWVYFYEIKRSDGEEVTAQVACTRTAEQIAEARGNQGAVESMKNFGAIDVLAVADKVQSPAYRGRTYISAFYDVVAGGEFSWDVSYELDHPGFGQQT